MEHIGEILKRQIRTNTSRDDTGTWSGAEDAASTQDTPCPICNGAGFVHPRLPSGKPDFGRVQAPCHCTRDDLAQEQQGYLLRYSNLGSLTRFTFDNLLPEGRSGNPINQAQFTHAYEAARSFAREPKGWLVLVGPSGCGKTHLAAAITNQCLSEGKPAFFISTPDLLDRLRASFNPNSEVTYDTFFEQVRNTPLLVLDDFGAQTSTTWAKEKLDQLLNHRFNSQLPTIIVTLTAIEELDSRLRTRLTDPVLCRTCLVEGRRVATDYSWDPAFELQRNMTFKTFDWRRVNLPAEQRENLEYAFSLATDFAKSPEGWLVFMGTTGCGKTHLAAAIVNYHYQAQKPALFVVVPDFLDHLRAAFSPNSKVSYDQRFERIKTAPFLVLDDFGEQSTTPWVREKLYRIINYRYNARLPMVVTTRYNLEEILEGIESSISSRLVDPKISVPFWIMAPDYRGDSTSKPKSPRRRKGNWR